MIYEWIERNRKDIDILTSFLVTAIPVVMLYSEALGITENTIPDAKQKAKRVLGYPEKQ